METIVGNSAIVDIIVSISAALIDKAHVHPDVDECAPSKHI